METFIKVLPIVIVILCVILIREGFSFYKYKKFCKLHEASKAGQVQAVRRLLQEGHPVNAADPSYGLTPLHFAVRNGRVEVARLLIQHGASLTQPSANGITPLDWAAAYMDRSQHDALVELASREQAEASRQE